MDIVSQIWDLLKEYFILLWDSFPLFERVSSEEFEIRASGSKNSADAWNARQYISITLLKTVAQSCSANIESLRQYSQQDAGSVGLTSLLRRVMSRFCRLLSTSSSHRLRTFPAFFNLQDS